MSEGIVVALLWKMRMVFRYHRSFEGSDLFPNAKTSAQQKLYFSCTKDRIQLGDRIQD